jgi:endonuclease-3
MTRSKEERMRVILDLMEEHYGKEDSSNQGLNDPFRTLIGCVLSHRTRDENSSRAAQNLFEDVEGPGDILRMAPEELKTRIRCSGFYNQKARNIRTICQILVDKYSGVVPRDREALIDLHGVGPKTADIVLSHAFASPAIAVDVHVATVARRLGLVESEASPERVKEVLESLVPPVEYMFVDNAFVRHGKEFCSTRNPRCSDCFINSMCEYFQQSGTS